MKLLKKLKIIRIRFNDTQSSEDNSFNNLCLIANPLLNYSNEIIYLYKDNKNSENSDVIKDIINLRNSSKKNTEKKNLFGLKTRESLSNFSACIKREKTQVFGFHNLKSKSKLFNMYLEVNDDSPKSERFRPKQRESIHYKRKSVTKFDDNKTIEEKSENDKKESEIIFVEHNEDINCKSEYAFSNDQNFSNNDDFNEEENEKPALKRGLTVKEDLMPNIKLIIIKIRTI